MVSRTRKADVHELRVVRDPSSYFVEMTEEERQVTDLVTETVLPGYSESVGVQSGFLLASPQRQVSELHLRSGQSRGHPGQPVWPSKCTKILASKPTTKIRFRPIIDQLIRDVLPKVDLKALRAKDSKYGRFKEVLLAYLKEHPAEKVVVFSYYPGTLEYLAERLDR